MIVLKTETHFCSKIPSTNWNDFFKPAVQPWFNSRNATFQITETQTTVSVFLLESDRCWYFWWFKKRTNAQKCTQFAINEPPDRDCVQERCYFGNWKQLLLWQQNDDHHSGYVVVDLLGDLIDPFADLRLLWHLKSSA